GVNLPLIFPVKGIHKLLMLIKASKSKYGVNYPPSIHEPQVEGLKVYAGGYPFKVLPVIAAFSSKFNVGFSLLGPGMVPNGCNTWKVQDPLGDLGVYHLCYFNREGPGGDLGVSTNKVGVHVCINVFIHVHTSIKDLTGVVVVN